MIIFQVFIKFWPTERITKNMMSHLYLNEERYYSEENTCENEVFCSTILYHRKKLNMCLNCQYITHRSNHWRCSVKIGFLKIFGKFTGKQPVAVSFLIKLQPQAIFLQNNFEQLLLKCKIGSREIRLSLL